MKKYTPSQEAKMYEAALRAMNVRVNSTKLCSIKEEPGKESPDPSDKANAELDK